MEIGTVVYDYTFVNVVLDIVNVHIDVDMNAVWISMWMWMWSRIWFYIGM